MPIQTAKEQTKRARNAALRILKLKKNKLLRAAKVVNLKFPKMALKDKEKAIPREESEPLTDSYTNLTPVGARKDICFKRLC